MKKLLETEEQKLNVSFFLICNQVTFVSSISLILHMEEHSVP